MADNFDFKKYLAENKLGPFAKLKTLNEDSTSDRPYPMHPGGFRSDYSRQDAEYRRQKALQKLDEPEPTPGKPRISKHQQAYDNAKMVRIADQYSLQAELFNYLRRQDIKTGEDYVKALDLRLQEKGRKGLLPGDRADLIDIYDRNNPGTDLMHSK